MNKEFVPYELAVKLKEIGFEKECLAYYSLEKGFEKAFIYAITPYQLDLLVQAPTFSQAFRWFRNKYGVHSSPRKYDETQWWVEWGIWTSSIGTFEESEIAWLTKLIELTEIIETRTK